MPSRHWFLVLLALEQFVPARKLTANVKLPETRTQLSFQSAQNQSQLAEVMIVKCLLGLGRIF
jgi:hypothetical protein